MIKTCAQLEKEEEQILAPYAMKSSMSAGRVHKEPRDPYRLPFQRDRDRIMHCKSFRRLQAKTQVFVAYYGDHYRDRLTHSIEVSQIARGLSRTLGLNEDLAECISIAHDLGHTPFGHGGEEALNKIMQHYNQTFEHNEQSRRILEKLERVNPNFDGLNVSKEVLDGMLKHNTHNHKTFSKFENYPPDVKRSGTSRRTKVRRNREQSEYLHLEAQVVDISDEIAYINHDLDDGLRSGIITLEQISDFQIWKKAEEIAIEKYGASILDKDEQGAGRYRSRVISKMISQMIQDAQQTTENNLQKNKINSIDKVRSYKGKLITFSKKLMPQVREIRSFLLQNFYNHEKVAQQIEKGKKIIENLFNYYFGHPQEMPSAYTRLVKNGEKPEVVVKDYIAGMTDHFAEEKFSEINS